MNDIRMSCKPEQLVVKREVSTEDTAFQLRSAFLLHQQGRLEEAEALYREIVQSDPEHFEALRLLAIIAVQKKRFEDSLVLFDHALKINPRHAATLNNQGVVYEELHRFDEALCSYEHALAVKPDYAEASLNRGVMLQELGRFDEAVLSYDHALTNDADNARIWFHRGNVLQDLKRYGEAVFSFEKALAINPDYAIAYANLGNVLQDLKRYEEAVLSYDRAIAVNPDSVRAYVNRGIALQELKRYEEAVFSFEKACAINPDYAIAYANLGNVLQYLKRYGEAVLSYDKAIALKPDYAEAHSDRGVALQGLQLYEEALLSYDRALLVRPDYAEACYNRGVVLQKLKRHVEALASYEQALALKPDYDFLSGMCLNVKMQMCDWRDFECQLSRLFQKIERSEKVAVPFSFLSISDSLLLQKKVAMISVGESCFSPQVPPAISKRSRHEKIRIGYYSADFHDHATAYLMAELFELHDRSRFELFAFSFGPDRQDKMRKRVAAAFDHFFDVRTRSDAEIVLFSRDLEIDIAIDLKGFTKGFRRGIFALRAAPIQVSYLGYPGTMGVGYIDYLIADSMLIPEGSRKYYTEKIVYLPDSYQVNDTKRVIAKKLFTRKECGLPEQGFVFACFNNNHKITPATFDGWMRILGQVEGSVLWLLEDNVAAADNLRNEAMKRGVDAARIVFAKRMPLAEHLARHRSGDLFLDTFPYNAHTTASDALWAGLPLLTLLGESFAGRVAASLLNAMQLPELITSKQEEYEALAIELASNPAKLGNIRRKLEQNRLATPLFDTRRFTQKLEKAYSMMYERYQEGLEPDHLFSLPSAQSSTGTISQLQQEYACCPLCGGKSSLYGRADCSRHTLWHEPLPRILEWMRCPGCHHVYTRHFWTQAGIDELFRNAQQNQLAGFGAIQDAKRANWVPVVGKALNLLGGYSSIMRNSISPAWVDVGCGDGALVMTAGDFGFTALGLDARSEAVRRIIELGFKAEEGDFMQCTFERKLDVLSMMDVLEHMPYPGLALGKAAELIRPGGVLVISLPDLTCSSWRMMDAAKSNPYWMEIEHYHNFSRERLIALLGERGFDVADFGIPNRYKAQMELYAVRK